MDASAIVIGAAVGGIRAAWMIGAVIFRGNPALDVLLDRHAECFGYLLGNALIGDSGVTRNVAGFGFGAREQGFRAFRTTLIAVRSSAPDAPAPGRARAHETSDRGKDRRPES